MFCFSYHSPDAGTKQNNFKTYFITNQKGVEFANQITSQYLAKKSPAMMYQPDQKLTLLQCSTKLQRTLMKGQHNRHPSLEKISSMHQQNTLMILH